MVHIPAGKICLVYFALNMLSCLFFGESTCICARSCLFGALGSERATLYIDVLDLTENFLGERALVGPRGQNFVGPLFVCYFLFGGKGGGEGS